LVRRRVVRRERRELADEDVLRRAKKKRSPTSREGGERGKEGSVNKKRRRVFPKVSLLLGGKGPS